MQQRRQPVCLVQQARPPAPLLRLRRSIGLRRKRELRTVALWAVKLALLFL